MGTQEVCRPALQFHGHLCVDLFVLCFYEHSSVFLLLDLHILVFESNRLLLFMQAMGLPTHDDYHYQ